MPKVVTQTPQAVVSVYNQLIPFLEGLNRVTYLTDLDKRDRAVDFTIEILIKALNKHIEELQENEKSDFTREYITRVRNIISTKDNVSQIIQYMKCVTK